MDERVPACAGSFRAIKVFAPEGSLLNACAPAAVAAASQGTMNNLAMGVRGIQGWDYYETLGGGMGAGATGGAGQASGGDGLIREYEFLDQAEVTLLTERRNHAPWGLSGGQPGAVGENLLNGRRLAPKVAVSAKAGDRLAIHTPGGGGYGTQNVT